MGTTESGEMEIVVSMFEQHVALYKLISEDYDIRFDELVLSISALLPRLPLQKMGADRIDIPSQLRIDLPK